MFVRLALTCALALSVSSASMAAAETASTGPSDCWSADEFAAARVGDLQSTLMVLALKCQDTAPDTLAAFNKFMADKRDIVVKDKYLIQGHFVRRLGPVEGMKASAAYDTRLGNQNSSPVVDVAQCEKAGAHARLAASAAEGDLPELAGMVAGTSPLPSCPVAVAAARPAAMVIPVWHKPAPVVAPAPAPAAALTPAVVPAVAVVAPGTASPAAARPAAVPSQADAVKALQAAVAALSQVAASLQPATPAPTPAALAEHEE